MLVEHKASYSMNNPGNYLPFRCNLCIFNFPTRIERNEHILCHFTRKTCTSCDIQVVQIGDDWYELKLHVGEECCNQNYQNCEPESIKVEPMVESQIEPLEPIEDVSKNSSSFDASVSREIADYKQKTTQAKLKPEEIFILDSIAVKVEADIEVNVQSPNADKLEEDMFQDTSQPDNTSQLVKKKSYTCGICGKTYESYYSFYYHRKTHRSKSEIYECDQCDRSYSNFESFRHHRYRHKRENKRTNCKICYKFFNVAFELRAHESECFYTCDYCHLKIRYKHHLIRHMKCRHERPAEKVKEVTEDTEPITQKIKKIYKCEHCDKIYESYYSFNSHRKTHTRVKAPDAEQYKCKICSKVLSSLKILNYHLAKHEGKTDYQCEICLKYLTQSGGLTQHMKTHSESPLLMCSYCGQGFKLKNHLAVHLNSHTGHKPYVCKFCNKAFGNPTVLRSHIRVHTGEKPYKCVIDGCERSYAHQVDLKRHRYSIHGIWHKKHICPICSKAYPENKLLKKHLQSHELKQMRDRDDV